MNNIYISFVCFHFIFADLSIYSENENKNDRNDEKCNQKKKMKGNKKESLLFCADNKNLN